MLCTGSDLPHVALTRRLRRGGRAAAEQNNDRGQQLDASHHRERQYVVRGGVAKDSNNGWGERKDCLIDRDDQSNRRHDVLAIELLLHDQWRE